MKIKGRAKLMQKLKRIPIEVKKDVREALVSGADEMVDLAKRFVSVDQGDLRDSIEWRFGDAERAAHAQGIGDSHELGVVIYAGNSGVRYPHLVEFGTTPHVNKGKFGGTFHPGTSASPFFYPAFRLIKRKARGRATRAMNKAIKRIAAR